MEIFILFTCDKWKSHTSRVLRGAFTDVDELEDAKKILIKNNVVDSTEEFDVVMIAENEFEANGGYY